MNEPSRVVPAHSDPADTRAGRSVEPASVWARPVRFLVDDFTWALVASVLIGPAAIITSSAAARLALWLFAGALAIVVPVAVSGRSAGARVSGTTVVRSGTCGLPGWRASFVRWIVPVGPWLVASGVYALDLGRRADVVAWACTIVAEIAIYVGVVTRPDRRGLHDRAADTAVVRTASLRPNGPTPSGR